MCGELRALEKTRKLGLWCDGFIPDESVLIDPAPHICGKVWIMGCSKIEAEWDFILYLTGTVHGDIDLTAQSPEEMSYDKIDWTVLLPPDDQTGWFKVDLEGCKLTVVPSAAYESEEDVLKRLGYNQQWLDFGIITMEDALGQYTELFTSGYPNEEHYRCAAFNQCIENKTVLTDQEIENIFKLTDNGPDKCNLHVNRLMALLDQNLCTDDQLARLAEYKEFHEDPLQKRFKRELLIHKIKKQGLADDVLDEIKTTTDSIIHEYLLNHHDLNREHLLWLKDHGLNKAVRNRSKQMLNSRKYQV